VKYEPNPHDQADLCSKNRLRPQVSVHPHQFSAREFRFGRAEVGHVHDGGIVDVPFPRPIRDALVAEGLAEEHHWVTNSGWVTFRVQ
jgi:Family of unknown function (DUF5519)